MPVDPTIKKAVDQMLQLMPENWDNVEATSFRQAAKAYDEYLKMDVPVSNVEDFKIPVDGAEIRARLYSNDPSSDQMIVYFHGGGFVIGDIESHDSICRVISKRSGAKVISVDYRLAPEHKFPIAVEDAYNSFLWVRENNQRFGISKEKVAVMGDSAGGNLCAALSVKCIEDREQVPALSVMFYPVVAIDLSSQSVREYSEGFALSEGISRWFHANYVRGVQDMLSPYLSPLTFGQLSGMPESIVLTAEYDTLRDQGETFVSALKKNSVEATGIRALGMVHGFLTYIKISKNARGILEMVSSLIGSVLSGK